MTDVSSVKAHADLQPAAVALYGNPLPPVYTNGSPALDGTIEEEESSTIKCICGFADDDGDTVLCEKCDTWQHIICYYESPHHVPDIHECTDCQPRPVDEKRAAEKQKQRRELHSIGERKGRPKTAPKNHKKRVKDPLGTIQPNGWAGHANSDMYYAAERKSGSPRDQPPPSKRPKTSHRTTGSINILSQTPALAPASRKRASSTMHSGHSPVKSPTDSDSPQEDFSVEFMNLYRQPEAPPPKSNGFNDIRVANDIATWLNDREALAEATGGREPGEVYTHFEQTIEDLEEIAPVITKRREEDQSITAHGLHPLWQYLTVDVPVPEGALIGELKGQVGRKEDYCSDAANRWDLLRHPEPFVFFPPHLPIYIDTRHEGTLLRYARRSCRPNMQMKILTQGSEHGVHFCFIASRPIEPNEELTVGWEIDPEIRQKLNDVIANGDIRKEGFKKIEPWVATVLANFGGCACDPSRGECLLERARRPNNTHTDSAPPPKKSRRTKKAQTSPLSTGHATNSRAGSEAYVRNGADDDNMDSRSTSGSHKSSSRDITPATHFSVDGGEKISDRERRKIQQQERLFEQLEEQNKSRRGKRNSASSTLNTPGLSSSKQLGHSEPSPSARNPREHSHGVARKTSGASTKKNGRAPSKPKPVYVDRSTQTEDDKHTTLSTTSPIAKPRTVIRPRTFKHRLIQQAREERELRERNRSASVKSEASSPALKDVMSGKASPAPVPAPALVEEPSPRNITTEPEPVTVAEGKGPAPTKEPNASQPADVEMKDVEEISSPRSPSPKVEQVPDAPKTEISEDTSHPPIQPPPPPWPSKSDSVPPVQPVTTSSALVLPVTTPSASVQLATTPSAPLQCVTTPSAPIPPVITTPSAPSPKTVDLSVQLPSSDSIITAPTANSTVTPNSVSGSTVTQSPVNLPTVPSPFSPSVTNAVNPGPARKKLSLSDYTSRRAKLAQTQSSGAHPTGAPSQLTSSPTLSNASLPNQVSPSAKTPEPTALGTVTEKPKKEQSATAA